MRKRNPISIILYLGILALILWAIFSLFSTAGNDVPYSEVVSLIEQGQVKSFVVANDSIRLELRVPYNGKTSLITGLADAEVFRREMWDQIQQQYAAGTLESFDFVEENKLTYYDMILPLLIVGLILLILWMLLVGRANSSNPMSNFGKARTVLGIPDGKKVTFDDVAGADEE